MSSSSAARCIGSSVAWLFEQPDFDGSVLVVERDPTYEFTSTTHTNSCIRQQFSNEINVRISQFGAEFIKNFRDFMGDDRCARHSVLHSYGYMYLADTEAFADACVKSQRLQACLRRRHQAHDAGRDRRDYPFYNLDDIVGANHNPSTRAISTATRCSTGGGARRARTVSSI